MTAKILCLDIERQSAVVDGVWELGSRNGSWINPSRVIEPSRTICFAYRWEHEPKTKFVAEWDGGFEQDNASMAPGGGHFLMIKKAQELLTEADYVVGWNSKSFDIKHLRGHMYAYDLLPPAPHVDIDLMIQCKRNFSFMANSMAYISKVKSMEGKAATGGADLWRTLRYADGDILRRAQRRMKKYNLRDVDLTLELFYDMRPWLSNLNLGLYSEDSDEMSCSNCESTDIQYRGSAGNLTYRYRRFQCNSCGKWGKDTHSFTKTTTVGI
jgi:hypothetical protein